MNDIGQRYPISVAQVIIYDTDGKAHGWEVTGGFAEWSWTGVGPSGRSTAEVTLTGEFRRRTKHITHTPQGEIE